MRGFSVLACLARVRGPSVLAAATLGLVLTAAGPAGARDIPPAPSTYVLDEGAWLSSAEEARLSADLLQYERDTSNQIVVAVFRSLEDEDLADFSQRVAEAWGVGLKERSNGILLAMYVAEKQIDIEVGYGLEPVVTDLIASEIRTGILVPAFRQGRFADGIFAAVDALKAAARGEFEGTGHALSDAERRDRGPPPIVLFLIFLAIVILVNRARRGGGGVILGPPGWGPSGRGYRSFDRGGFGGLGGGGSFGGGGGGGGGGFLGGGGSFGGGGARGGW